MKMLKNLKLMAVVLGAVLFTNTSFASLLLEPHVGYNLSGSGTNNGLKLEYSGPQIGARVGYQNLGFMTGLDYTMSSGDVDSTFAGVKSTQEFSTNDVGIFVGYNFPILIRVWGTYYFSNTMELKTSNIEYSGNTKELGVGFTALPFLSINAMYRMVTHDEAKSSVATTSLSDYNYNEIVLGVSLPFNL
jgi:hypothetical protein